MAGLRPKETSHHRQHTAHMPVDLQHCTFVFVRHDAHRTPLRCTYDGPFRVLERVTKFFTLDVNGRRDTISEDRLKPAFLDADFGLHEGEGLQPPDGLRQPPTLPPPSAAAPDVVRDKPPLRILAGVVWDVQSDCQPSCSLHTSTYRISQESLPHPHTLDRLFSHTSLSLPSPRSQ